MISGCCVGDFSPKVVPPNKNIDDLQTSPGSIANLQISPAKLVEVVNEIEPSCANPPLIHMKRKKRYLEGILKSHSSFPKPPSFDDTPPVRLADKGLLHNYTRDKNGR